MLKNAYIPYGAYYSSPFCKWMGSLQNYNSINMSADTSKVFFEKRKIDMNAVDFTYFGQTMLQPGSFFGAGLAARYLGINVPGMFVNHACATSTNLLYTAACAVETGTFDTAYCMTTDRLSNGAHVVWPNPKGAGGEVISENVNLDNMAGDPITRTSMVKTADRVAEEFGFTKEDADELVLLRCEQYKKALENDREFQKKYMLPIEIVSKKETKIIDQDEGVFLSSKEGLAKLKPVNEGGIHTYGGQTHPADGCAGVIITTQEKAKEYETDRIPVQILSYGYNRTKPAFMPAAPADAVKMAADKAGIKIEDITVFKNHAPFAVNDLHLAKVLGIRLEQINNFGTSLIFGHPQGPTVSRLLMEGIEEAVIKGGGYVSVSGCAAGDIGAAIIVKVG